MLLTVLDAAPRRALLLLCLACMAMLGFGLYLQHVVGLNPCPMCIVQRYALLLVAIFALLTSLTGRRRWHIGGVGLVALTAVGGAFVAARQSWLQWYPPEVSSCGRDLYGMIETFPLKRAIPMIFKGSGDCTAVDWTFLGGSLANWSFVVFACIVLVSGVLIWRRAKARV
jgi:disulfide bond formation protein DsbB